METSLPLKRITSVWIITILVLFIFAIVFGITMRFNQGSDISINPVDFYSLLTVHGITMIGIWSVAGIVGVQYLLSRYVKTSTTLSIYSFVFTVVGVVMIWAAAFIGKFHTAWTFLYPLPFYIAWEEWATPIFFLGLTILSVAWLAWTVGLMLSIFKKYTLKQTLAWQHLTKNPSFDTPPIILISTVTLVGIIVCLLSAVLLMVLLFAEYFSSGQFVNDPLLIKNITYFFGHTIANEALYLGLAVVYELMPEVSGRPKLHTTWYVALGWNFTFIFVLTAFFHHMYMDFVQPEGFQIIGQFASYFASIPAAAVTAFSVIVVVFNNKVKWSMANLLWFLGVTGWVIGGIGAVIDATITNNVVLHNTLWVPAHFHTYNAMGNVLFSLGFFYWVSSKFAGEKTIFSNKLIMGLLIIGGFGFVLMFYMGGASSIPRRFAFYPEELSVGAMYASFAAWFATIYLVASLLILYEIVKKCLVVFSKSYSASA